MNDVGFVYAISSGDAVKIGWSKDPYRRIHNLKIGSPIDQVLLGFIPANKQREAELHDQFFPHHIRGEWFRKEGAVAAFLKDLPVAPARQRKPDKRTAGRPFLDRRDKASIGPIRQKLSDEVRIVADAFEVGHLTAEQRRHAAHVRSGLSDQRRMIDGSSTMLTAHGEAIDYFAAHWPPEVAWPASVSRPAEIDIKRLRKLLRSCARFFAWEDRLAKEAAARLPATAGISMGLLA